MMFARRQYFGEAVCGLSIGANPPKLNRFCFIFLTKLLVVRINVPELGFEFRSVGSDEANGLLVIAIENVWTVWVKAKILKEPPPPNKFSAG